MFVPTTKVSCQLDFQRFVSCQLKFWPYVSCQLTPYRPSCMDARRYGIFASRAGNPFKTLQFILYSKVIFAAFVDFDNI